MELFGVSLVGATGGAGPREASVGLGDRPVCLVLESVVSQRRGSNPRPMDYEGAARFVSGCPATAVCVFVLSVPPPLAVAVRVSVNRLIDISGGQSELGLVLQP
jgi:hypothetical protein